MQILFHFDFDNFVSKGIYLLLCEFTLAVVSMCLPIQTFIIILLIYTLGISYEIKFKLHIIMYNNTSMSATSREKNTFQFRQFHFLKFEIFPFCIFHILHHYFFHLSLVITTLSFELTINDSFRSLHHHHHQDAVPVRMINQIEMFICPKKKFMFRQQRKGTVIVAKRNRHSSEKEPS